MYDFGYLGGLIKEGRKEGRVCWRLGWMEGYPVFISIVAGFDFWFWYDLDLDLDLENLLGLVWFEEIV